MNKYEAMFIIRPDLSEDEKKAAFSQINESVDKHEGKVTSSAVWAERRKLYFPIKKHREGMYYLVQFEAAPTAIKELNPIYGLNEFILRVLITRAN